MDELASINALYNEAKGELESSKADQQELQDLREMKEDIERKEKQQAAIIENQVPWMGYEDMMPWGERTRWLEGKGCAGQKYAHEVELTRGEMKEWRSISRDFLTFLPKLQAKRLEELEKLYKDEQVTRKRYFNQMEDMKGKIRVFCRIRPILNFEKDKGQQFALNLPDELTITHLWKDEKKPREYNFDQVRDSQMCPL